MSNVASAKSAFDSMRVKPSSARTSRMRSTSTVSSKNASKPFGGATRFEFEVAALGGRIRVREHLPLGQFQVFGGASPVCRPARLASIAAQISSSLNSVNSGISDWNFCSFLRNRRTSSRVLSVLQFGPLFFDQLAEFVGCPRNGQRRKRRREPAIGSAKQDRLRRSPCSLARSAADADGGRDRRMASSGSKASAMRRSTPQEWHLTTMSEASPEAPNSRRVNVAGLQGTLPLCTKSSHGKSVRWPSRQARRNRTDSAEGAFPPLTLETTLVNIFRLVRTVRVLHQLENAGFHRGEGVAQGAAHPSRKWRNRNTDRRRGRVAIHAVELDRRQIELASSARPRRF